MGTVLTLLEPLTSYSKFRLSKPKYTQLPIFECLVSTGMFPHSAGFYASNSMLLERACMTLED